MAEMLEPDKRPTARVLDPGAGAGVLGIAAAATLLDRGAESVRLTAVETAPAALRALNQSLSLARSRLGPGFSFDIVGEDFLDLGGSTAAKAAAGQVDYVICNPPYFKLSPSDRRGGAAPNIYARFMEISGQLLPEGGQLVFIVPRSYTSGFYFRRFRRRFHSSMTLNAMYLFDSRREAFRRDGVLQENLIIGCVKGQAVRPGGVQITVSHDLDDLGESPPLLAPLSRIVDPSDENAWVLAPETEDDLALLETIEMLPERLSGLGLAISTGPVVPFRAREYLTDLGSERRSIPLLWLQHVRRGRVEWPLGEGLGKSEGLAAEAPGKLQIPDQTCVLLRRFSAKEESRRLTAAPLLKGTLPGQFFAVENHVNVILGVDREMKEDEAVGLATLLNSGAYDRYFRILNGNTQVSATEIRGLPFPPLDYIRLIGEKVRLGDDGEAAAEEALRGNG